MKKFTANLSIKIISLFLAIVIWGTITNTKNPLVPGTVEVPVEVENESYVYDQNRTYKIQDSRIVSINYKTRTDTQTRIKASDFKVYIDLKDLASNDNVPIRYVTYNGVDDYISNVQIVPSTLKVTTDELIHKSFTISYKTKGKLADGRTVGNVILSPTVLYVSGSNEVINDIDKLEIDVDLALANADDSFKGDAEVAIYLKDGSIISNEKVDLGGIEKISYTVLLNATSTVQINAPVVGIPENGYVHTETIVEPNVVLVEGPKSFLKNYYVVDLAPVSIEGLASNAEFVLKLSNFLPNGLKSKVEDIKVTAVITSNVINSPTENDIGPHNESNTTANETMESNVTLETIAEASTN